MQGRNDASVILFVLLPLIGAAQTIDPERTTDWGRAGLQLDPPTTGLSINIMDFGAASDGSVPADAALAAAFAQAEGAMAVIGFPAGEFLFNAAIDLPDSVVIRGAGADQTTFTFDLGGAGHCIQAVGQELPAQYPLIADASRGDTSITIANMAGIQEGDHIRLYRDDASLVTSPWAVGQTGQLARVIGIDADTIQLSSPLRAAYTLIGNAYFRKMQPAFFSGIECLRIVRADQTAGQFSNIWLGLASHCWVRGVESVNCNFAHADLYVSTNCEISGSYFHHAFDHGSGGKAYGVNMYHTSGENLVVDNIFEHLRHSMIVQVGANGNVFAYNYSTDPFWTGTIYPPNSAGDLVLHGDHPYLNLFEGNIVQNIVIDDSHGTNGPFNTLFRNRAELWGLVMSNSPATDSVNIAGNVISQTTDPLGLFVINGGGHLLHGNLVDGTYQPPGTDQLPENSLFLDDLPAFLSPIGALPLIGPGSQQPGTVPAKLRSEGGGPLTVCNDAIPTRLPSSIDAPAIIVHPNPFTDRIMVRMLASCSGPFIITLHDPAGREVLREEVVLSIPVVLEDLGHLRSGSYLLEVKDAKGTAFRSMVVKE